MKRNLLKIAAGLSAVVGYLAMPGVFELLPKKVAAVVTAAGAIIYVLTGRQPEKE